MYSTIPIHWNIKSAPPAQAEVVLGQLSTYLGSWVYTVTFMTIRKYSMHVLCVLGNHYQTFRTCTLWPAWSLSLILDMYPVACMFITEYSWRLLCDLKEHYWIFSSVPCYLYDHYRIFRACTLKLAWSLPNIQGMYSVNFMIIIKYSRRVLCGLCDIIE